MAFTQTVQRYFIYLSYDGTAYCGWQVQPNGITVQERLEGALGTLLHRRAAVTGAGRTDAGVHARCLAAHFDAEEPLPDAAAFAEKLNRMLPPDIAILGIAPVIPEAHSRFDAIARTYRYYLSPRKDPFSRAYCARVHGDLDVERMNEAAERLLHYRDFTSFSKLHTDVKTNLCTVTHAAWSREGDTLCFTIRADRFLRNMVRAVVGTLLEVGRGKCSVAEFCEIVEAKNRCRAGNSADARGLFLWEIEYPAHIFLQTDGRCG